MGSMNDIGRGSVIVRDGELWEVTDHLHARTGMKKPTMWTKLKNYKTGKVVEHQFHPSDNVQFATIESKEMEYLYRDGEFLVFMDQGTFDQPQVPVEMLEERLPYLQEGAPCRFYYHGEQIGRVTIPDTIVVEVTNAPPYARGDTASGGDYRPVEVNTGLTVKVPPFIQEGQKIKIDTRTGEYLGKA